jgi:hypothetical protein
MNMKFLALRPDQMQIATHPAKEKTVDTGRRFGKTVLGGAVAMNCLRQHGKVSWVAPIYKNTRALWRYVKWACSHLVKPGLVDISESERTIETFRGGVLSIYSADNIDGIRGEWFNLCVADEASRISDEAWYDAIVPTLADYDGDSMKISTPKGRNHFYRGTLGCQGYRYDSATGLFVAMPAPAQVTPRRAWWQAPSNANPLPGIHAEYQEARTKLPDRSFRQEWQAEFLDDTSNVFGDFSDCVQGTLAEPQQGQTYYGGVDPARARDYFASCVMDGNGHVVAFSRVNRRTWNSMYDQTAAMMLKYHAATYVDSTGVGDPVLEELWKRKVDAQGIDYRTNDNKTRLIEELIRGVENRQVTWPASLDVLTREMTVFEAEIRPGGRVRYEAPENEHDDCVNALALANMARRDLCVQKIGRY